MSRGERGPEPARARRRGTRSGARDGPGPGRRRRPRPPCRRRAPGRGRRPRRRCRRPPGRCGRAPRGRRSRPVAGPEPRGSGPRRPRDGGCRRVRGERLREAQPRTVAEQRGRLPPVPTSTTRAVQPRSASAAPIASAQVVAPSAQTCFARRPRTRSAIGLDERGRARRPGPRSGRRPRPRGRTSRRPGSSPGAASSPSRSATADSPIPASRSVRLATSAPAPRARRRGRTSSLPDRAHLARRAGQRDDRPGRRAGRPTSRAPSRSAFGRASADGMSHACLRFIAGMGIPRRAHSPRSHASRSGSTAGVSPSDRGDRLAGQVVRRRAEAAGRDDEVGAGRARPRRRVADRVEVVGEGLDPADRDADRRQAPGQLAGVRVARLADRQLGADAEQLGGQERSDGSHVASASARTRAEPATDRPIRRRYHRTDRHATFAPCRGDAAPPTLPHGTLARIGSAGGGDERHRAERLRGVRSLARARAPDARAARRRDRSSGSCPPAAPTTSPTRPCRTSRASRPASSAGSARMPPGVAELRYLLGLVAGDPRRARGEPTPSAAPPRPSARRTP